ncbi:MAG TPA: P1 family peptidase [Longimicrobiales bacterium]
MPESHSNSTITAVPGVRVGHATHERARTGCTVLLGPFRGACDVRGLATGTREIHTLSPGHLVPTIDAVLLTGGSAFGLAAADGVMSWVAEHGGGFDTGVARVPIVPAAVIFDLTPEAVAPDAALGRLACEQASSDAVGQGQVGAGTGATIGKLRGPAFAQPGGLGCYALRCGAATVGAIAVVNALGDVLDFDGRIVAGARADDGRFIDTLRTLASLPPDAAVFARPGRNTTIAAVATDAPLTRGALQQLARAASCAIVRRVAPANTVFDGDVVFALSTSAEAREHAPAEIAALSAAAQLALEHAILRAAAPGKNS